MATTRTRPTITSSWAAVCTGAGTAQIQGGTGIVLVAVGATTPANDVGTFGFHAGPVMQNTNAAENIYMRTDAPAGTMFAAVWTV